ncbi:Fic family protein [Desertivirga brevis]|uniref:Fic family protein n=1 Tax=Desertivirga brevis TaxID=2810310 RepID=UPI001A9722E6|nr:Fic family protein [Pedobacter sp. SYSU D00873]
MDKNVPLHLQEIIFSSSLPEVSREINALAKAGSLKKIAPRIFTSNLAEDPAAIIRRNIFKIVGHLYPNSILSHRSALEFKPTSSGNLFFTSSHNRRIELPGIILNFMKGPEAVEGDYFFSGKLRVSQQERAILESLQSSKNVGPDSKSLTLPEIEERLDQIIRVKGEEGLNAVRDRARELGQELGMEKEFNKLNRMIGALLNTKPSELLTSPLAIARTFGLPYDPKRIELFEKLFVELQQREFADISDPNTSIQAFRNFAFYESYFSNFIEGTKFKIEEAKLIIETGKPLPARDEDSHDVLGTYQVVSNQTEMGITPIDANDLLRILQYRHRIILGSRPYKKPGEFKSVNNRAGDTEFVDYTLVRGTLTRGFDFYQALRHPFSKAAYMMFMVSEVHPFLDGNGRIARIMMNAELVKATQARIIIPTVFREDYLGALRQLTRRNEPDTYIRMLQRAQLFSATIKGPNMDYMQNILSQSNAFHEGDEYILKVVTPKPLPWEQDPEEPQTKRGRGR